jgi:peptidyl-prolyl cis-trans isomerase B (cyclophilin B)
MCLLVVGCGSSGSKPSSTPSKATSTPKTTSTATGAPEVAAGCRRVARPKPRPQPHLPRPTTRLDPARTYVATVSTSCGTFAIRLDVRRAPLTAASFASLARRGFYDGLAFGRVAQGFVIQGGDPLGNGTGGPGYQVVEPPPASLHYTRGTVAMAKSGGDPSGASGSQFFVVTARDATASAGLTPDYALVGRVVSGMSTVDRIQLTPTQPPGDGAPQEPIVIERVTVRAGSG